MANVTIFLAELSAPSGLWAIILNWIESFTNNFGWTIVLFTIFIKIVLSPLDFYNRFSTRKNTLIQKRLSGEVQKINKTFANNRDMANQKVSSLYKREGYNMIGSCVFMLVNMILTLVIFFTIFSSLKEMSAYKMIQQYDEISVAYNTTEGNTDEKALASLEKYDEIKDNSSWLWIKSIWRNDTSNSIIPTYSQLTKIVNNAGNKEYSEYVSNISEVEYNKVMSLINTNNNGWNGYYILAILAGIVTFLSSDIAEKSNGVKKEKQLNVTTNDPTAGTMKIMKLVLPIIMVVFVLTYTASFAIYIVASSIMGILITFICNIFVKKLTKKEEDKYLAFIEKQSIIKNKQQSNFSMKQYKQIGDKL